MESYIKNEWGYKIFMSGLTSNKRGVMILLNNNFQHDIGRVVTDPNGNFIILEISLKGKKITLVNIYGPNEDCPQFYLNIKQKVEEFDNEMAIICGDWNMIIDPDLDCENYKHINNPRARSVVREWLDLFDFIDAYRLNYDEKKEFTWRKLNPDRKQARLDFFLINFDVVNHLDDCQIVPGYRSDHSGVILKLDFFEHPRGKGYWKFNNSLLKDRKYIKIVKDTIAEVLDLHVKESNNNKNNNNNNNNDNNNNENNEYTINDQLLLETILMMIRGETIKYSTYKKRKQSEDEKQLEKDIEKLEFKITNYLNDITEEDINKLDEKKNALQDIRKVKTEGVMLRSRCRYEDLGEKPSIYFLNLENRNFMDKVITKLVDANGNEYYNSVDILNLQKQYYHNLYKEDNNVIDDVPLNEVIGDNTCKLNEDESNSLEGEITCSELANALKNMKNSKSPGMDGFTVEFFKFFWVDLGKFILRSVNYAYKNKSLSITQNQGIITCIPKPNKSRHFLKNWRPISLLNVIYKLMSSVIANRLKSVLDKLISNDQKGFISGRYIGENIRTIYDILFESKQQHIPGLLVSVDFQQAFDTVSWKFIEKVLDYFNFGPSIKKWIRLFQTGAQSCILQNGHISDPFTLQRGCRQGDPISPYIFILCVEILGKMIRNDTTLKGIMINNKEYRLCQYADDTQLFLDGSEKSLHQLMYILNKFYYMSGLKINEDKTKALWIGAMGRSEKRICIEYNLDWEQKPLKILGVTFTAEVFDIWDQNWEDILHKVNSLLNIWSKRRLTLPGKITIIKSLVLSKFTHLFLALPNPPGLFLKLLERKLFKFLWSNGPDRVSRKNIIKNIQAGGLRMVNINAFITSLKVTWLRRLIVFSHSDSWSNLSRINFDKLFAVGDSYARAIINDLHNPFWIDILESWIKYLKSFKVDSLVKILFSPLWGNSNIHGNGNYIINEWFNKGIRNVLDLMDDDGYFNDFQTLQERFGIHGTFLNYLQLINRIPRAWKNIVNENRMKIASFKHNVPVNCYVFYLLRNKKGCRDIYDIILPLNEIIVPVKWQDEIGEIPNHEWEKINKNLHYIKEIKLRDFQFKINNRILVTNSFLFKIKKKDNNKCSYCNRETETISHLLYHCDKVAEFWGNLKIWLEQKASIYLHIDLKTIMFSKSTQALLSYLITVAKYYIYKSKFYSKNLCIKGFESFLRQKFLNEMYISKLKGTYDKFLGKWSSLYNYMSKL